MEISPRLRQILLELLKQEGIISVKALAEQVQISKRTVQRELEDVNLVLKPYQLTLLSKTGKGIWMEGSEEARENLKSALKKTDQFDANDKKQRRRQLIFEMLKNQESQKLFYYADLFGVSEATISKDMEAIEEWFSWMDLKIVRKQGYGVTLEGSEKGYRLALRRFMDENISRDIWRNVLNYGSGSLEQIEVETTEIDFYELMDLEIFDQVVNCLRKMHRTKISKMTESSYLGLAMHITIAITRLQKGSVLEEEHEFGQEWQNSEEWELAEQLAEILRECFGIIMPYEEISYICLHIKGARLQYVEKEESILPDQQEELERLANKMIDAFDGGIAYELKQDEELIMGLKADLKAVIVRIQNKIQGHNPLLNQVKENYPMVFRHTRSAVHVLEKQLGMSVSDGETAYLAMHFSAAMMRMEGRKESFRRVKIGVVCASGIGVSKLMESKLSQHFRDWVDLKSYALEDINERVESQVDFFVSSLNMQKERGCEVVCVSPLLPEKDMQTIEERIRHYEVLPQKKERADAEFARQLEEVSLMVEQIRSILKSCSCIKVDSNISFEELVEAMAEQAAIYPDYEYIIQRDILEREKIATQIFEEMGFALLHARTNGTLNPSITFCVTNGGKPFQNPYMKQIRGVIMMLMPRDSYTMQNSQILGFISSSLVEEEDFLSTIFEGDQEKMKQYLTRLLRQYFNQYLDVV